MPPVPRAAAKKGLSYRPMAEADLAFVQDVYISTRLEELAATNWPLEARHSFLADQFRLQHAYYRQHYPVAEWLIVEQGGQAVGRLYLEQRAEELRVIDIALMPESRGRGYGTAVLTDLIEQSHSAGRRVSIHVERNNPARQLYLRLGFAPVEEHGIYDLLSTEPPS